MHGAQRKTSTRRTLVVDRKFQYQFAVCAFLAQFVVAISFLSALQLRLRQIVLEYHTLEAQKIVDQVASNSLAIMIGVSVITGGLTFLLAIFFTNKIVGPLPRFKRALEELGQGNLSVRMILRPGDLLLEFAETFNRSLENLAHKVEAGEVVTSRPTPAESSGAQKPEDEAAPAREVEPEVPVSS